MMDASDRRLANVREPVLSVCLPTFNRETTVTKLVSDLMQVEGVEVCVHVDGSTDGTAQALQALSAGHPQLRVTSSENRGRASALLGAIAMASAPFVMLFDDDDDVSLDGLRALLPQLQALPDDCCGYVCHMNDERGCRLGCAFPTDRSNFLKLRFDQGVSGDKKEIVRTDLLRRALYRAVPTVRRAPTSLIWNRLALTHDVICLDLVLGVKRYMLDGYTRKNVRLRLDNPGPMREVNALRLEGYVRGRYVAAGFALRSLLAMIAYAIYTPIHAVRKLAR